jgi:hypothetical protein
MWGIDSITLTAIGTWALVIGTLFLMWYQTSQARAINSATSVMALRERFDSTQLRRARKYVAERLLHDKHDDITTMEVAAFFELLGTLTRRKVLDHELVWEAFGSWISAYYWALRSPVDLIGLGRERMKDPLLWHEFEWLDKRIQQMDVHKAGVATATPAERDVEAKFMLRRESNLDLEE